MYRLFDIRYPFCQLVSILEGLFFKKLVIIRYLLQEPVTVLTRSRKIYQAPIMALSKSNLSLLVENQGRINFGKFLKDTKVSELLFLLEPVKSVAKFLNYLNT